MQVEVFDQSRLLLLAGLCALLWTLESSLPFHNYAKHRFQRVLPNLGLTLVLVLTNLLLSFAFVQIGAFTESRSLGLLFLIRLPPWMVCLTGVVTLDLFAYFAHVRLHKSPLGWQFHRVHHSEKEVDVTTAFRQHPAETVWRTLWQLIAVVLFGLPLWVVAIYLMISAANAQLEHANVRVNKSLDHLLRLIIVTPPMHKVHHSREQRETDTNYSNIFSIWDRLFHTYTPQVDFNRLRFGLDGFDGDEKQSFVALLKIPFSGKV